MKLQDQQLTFRWALLLCTITQNLVWHQNYMRLWHTNIITFPVLLSFHHRVSQMANGTCYTLDKVEIEQALAMLPRYTVRLWFLIF